MDTATKTGIFVLLGSIVGGIFAILGSWISVWMQRKTEHQKWLLEKRAKVFGEFLLALETSQRKTGDYLSPLTKQKRKDDSAQIGQDIYEFFAPTMVQAKIVRFFVDEDSKDKIDKLVSNVYALHSGMRLGDPKYKKIVENKEALQKILEDNLKNLKWP